MFFRLLYGLLFGAYFEFVLSGFIAFLEPPLDQTFGDNGADILSGEWTSFYLSCCVLIVVVFVGILFPAWYIFQPSEKMIEPKFRLRHGMIVDSIKFKTRVQRASQFMSNLRFIIIIALIVN